MKRLLCLGAICLACLTMARERPNVLFIAIDDLRTELGCYGVKHAPTPNLDRLASQGVAFTRHFVQVPTCGASRYALLTGRSPSESGVTRSNAAAYAGASALSAKQLPGAQTFPELFRRSGYRTVLIGKISHTADGRVFAYNGQGDGRDELPHAWDDYATPLGQWKRGWGIFFAYANGKHREDGGGHKDLMDFTVEKDEDLPDGLMAQKAIAKLAQLKEGGKPFLMGLGFFKPHLPFVAPKQDWEAVAKMDVPAPTHPDPIKSPYSHGSGEFFKYNTPYEKSRPLARANALMAKRAYLSCVRYTDRQVGRVLDALKKLGLADNTIVVVWGDHGWFLGEVGLWAKHTPFERAVHSPLIIRAPKIIKNPGRTSDALAETLDIYPTLLELCRPSFSKTQHPLGGVSLVPVLTGAKKTVRDTAVSYWGNATTLRTSTHRFICKTVKEKKKDFALYDLRSEPDPVENLAKKKPELVQELLKKLPH